MKFKIKVRPNSNEQKIERLGELYVIHLKSSPVNNKANIELLKLLKKYFGKEVKIKSGFTSRNKIVELS